MIPTTTARTGPRGIGTIAVCATPGRGVDLPGVQALRIAHDHHGQVLLVEPPPERAAERVDPNETPRFRRLMRLNWTVPGEPVDLRHAVADSSESDDLVEMVRRSAPQLVVVHADEDRGFFERLLRGGMAERLLRRTRLPVLAARRGTGAYPSILLPTAFDYTTHRLLERALDLVAPGGEVELLHCLYSRGPLVSPMGGEMPGAPVEDEQERAIEEGRRLKAWFADADARIVVTCRRDHPRRGIVSHAAARKPSLVLMASEARRGASRVLWPSLAEYVLRHVDTSVLVVPVTPHRLD